MSLKRVLEDYKKGKITLDEAEREVRLFNIKEISNSVLDTHRDYRAGAPEVIFGEGKTDRDILDIVKKLVKERGRCIVTRLTPSRMKALRKKISDGTIEENVRAGVLIVRHKGYKTTETGGRVAVLCAGTSDISKAEEAKIISQEMGCRVYTFYDVGVAGIHRLIPAIEEIIREDIDAVIVAAGMEGTLPSVVAGLVDVPVIGLPISTGYGVGGRGEAALLAMLQSCSPGLATVNVDNGFGAGVVASIIANRVAKFRK
jgi:hypothetical protein